MSEETDLKRAQQELAEARARYTAAQKLKGKRQIQSLKVAGYVL